MNRSIANSSRACRALALGIALACTAALGGPTVELGLADLVGARVREPKSEDARAIEVWTTREAGAKIAEVLPGAYRLVMRGRFLGEPTVRYSMSLEVSVGKETVARRSYWPNALRADGKYHQLSMTFPVRTAGRLIVKFSYNDHASEEAAKAVQDAKLRAFAKTAGAKEMGAIEPLVDGGDVLVELEDSEILPVGSESFLLAGVTVERLPVAAIVTKVHSDKLHYYPGETAKIDVEMASVSSKPATATLVVELRRGLDRSQELHREEVTLAPGKAARKQLSLTTDEAYGYEIKGTVLGRDGAPGHALSEYFGVSENVFELSIQGWGEGIGGITNDPWTMNKMLSMPQDELEAAARASALSARSRFYNHVENFSWAPDDFFNLAPKEEAWWSGTMTYIKVKRVIKAKIRAHQAMGIKVLSYAQPYAIGLDTVNEMRVNPEFFAYRGNGAPAVSYNYDLLKSRARLDVGLKKGELGGGLNFFDLRTVDRGIDAVIASWKMFGWDGVRYDNRYYRANNPVTHTGKRATTEKNLDPYSARNVKRLKERFWKEIGPRWLISHNNGYRFRRKGNILGWEETVKDGLMCMDEETQGSTGGGWMNEWRNYFGWALQARRHCTKLGGYYQLFPPARGGVPTADMLYYVVACAATGSHPISCNVESSPAGRYGRFLTRYSAMFFARDLVPLPEPEKLLAFPDLGEGDLWWKDFARTRMAGKRRWLLFPLTVPPANERIARNPASTIRRAPASTRARLKLAAAPPPRAFLLTAGHEPTSQVLELRPVDGDYELTLPRFPHFAMLVVEKEGP